MATKGGFKNFGRVGSTTLAAIAAAKVAPYAEQLSDGARRGVQEGDNIVQLDQGQLMQMLLANYRRVNMKAAPFLVGLVPIRLRPEEGRTYIFIMNQSLVNGTFIGVGVGKAPGDLTAVPADALLIGPGFGSWEPWAVPTEEIWVVSNVANTAGYIAYAA